MVGLHPSHASGITDTLIGVFVLVAAATVSPAVAQPTAANPSDVAADFNNDGVANLVIGVPGETVGVLRTRSPER